jgi:hypothetical protein
MDTYFETAPPRRVAPSDDRGTWLPARLAGAALCLGVALIHVIDQGGFPGSKDPGYIAAGYYLLELAAVVAAVVLVRRSARNGWLLALAVAAGPLLGFVLTRGPGLPSATEDRGNWSEPIGVASLVVEAVLLLLCLYARAPRPAGSRDQAPAATRT